MQKKKDVLTTGDVARICNVAPRTVSKWFDSGQLRGYRIPGSKDRRIPLAQLVRFMRAHGIPLHGLDGNTTRVLLVDDNADLARSLAEALERDGRYEVRVANGPFDAGMIADQFRPHVIFVDIMIEDLNARAICKTLRDNPDLCDMRVVAITSELTDGEGHAVLQQGFDAWVPRPLELRTLIRCIEETSSIVH